MHACEIDASQVRACVIDTLEVGACVIDTMQAGDASGCLCNKFIANAYLF